MSFLSNNSWASEDTRSADDHESHSARTQTGGPWTSRGCQGPGPSPNCPLLCARARPGLEPTLVWLLWWYLNLFDKQTTTTTSLCQKDQGPFVPGVARAPLNLKGQNRSNTTGNKGNDKTSDHNNNLLSSTRWDLWMLAMHEGPARARSRKKLSNAFKCNYMFHNPFLVCLQNGPISGLLWVGWFRFARLFVFCYNRFKRGVCGVEVRHKLQEQELLGGTEKPLPPGRREVWVESGGPSPGCGRRDSALGPDWLLIRLVFHWTLVSKNLVMSAHVRCNVLARFVGCTLPCVWGDCLAQAHCSPSVEARLW